MFTPLPRPHLRGAVHTTVAPARPRVITPPKTKPAPPLPEPPWHVILIDDDDHTYDYVVEMLQSIFALPKERCYQLAKDVDENGRVIVATVHKELAELRCDQIQEYGPDPRVKECLSSMRAEMEPAE
jgi:ATP-dependent Clp protease adaptor protein ClpS